MTEQWIPIVLTELTISVFLYGYRRPRVNWYITGLCSVVVYSFCANFLSAMAELSDRQRQRNDRRDRLKLHLTKLEAVLEKVQAEVDADPHDLPMTRLRNKIWDHQTDARNLLIKLEETETLLSRITNPTQYASTIKGLETKLEAYDQAYDQLTERRKEHENNYNAQKASAEETAPGNNKQSPTIKRVRGSFFPSKSEVNNTVRHMKSSPTIGGSGSNQPSPTGAGMNMAIPSHHEHLHRSFVDLTSSYAESILQGDVGCFTGILPGSKVAVKKPGTLDVLSSSPGVDQQVPMITSSAAQLDDSAAQLPIANENNNTNTPKWTPGGPIMSKESMDLMDREWFEKNKDALAETKARFLQEASSSYQSYAPVRQEYDIYNPPPREPTPTIDPPSLPPPPRRRRQLAPIVTESEPKEEPKEEEGSETVVRHRKKGKSKTRSPRSAKGNTSPRTPSEVTENVFSAPERGEDSNPWPKQGLLQIQGRNADDPLAQWNRGRVSFEAA
ncbi:hypothetical protein D9613_009890 [Agrocybe pediades]|uniref:Uncharacterized protein n=1 Tax=Agrocybe pediades TaxID=84607 RepID=A0A8H4QXQ4_9AGAR|nr:hypothetical protein D9613_009890 [Agrocybe pediades]